MKLTDDNRLLRASETEIAGVRESIGLRDEDSIRRDVDMVQEWYDKQQHLPRIPLDRDVVEGVLVARKGSVEQTKQKIEKLFTLRSAIPEIASPRDILHPAIQKQLRTVVFAPLPKLNPDLTRVLIYKLNKNADEFVYADTLKYMFMSIEYRFRHDYCLGERYIYDMQHSNIGHVSKLNPIAFRNGELFLIAIRQTTMVGVTKTFKGLITPDCIQFCEGGGYGSRTFGIHFINAPSFMATILSILKPVLSSKLFSRIAIHPTLEDLHKVISKSILPKEYGGEERSLVELAERWKQELEVEDNRQFLIAQESLRSDEKLRVGGRATDEMLGIPGSFKNINID